MGEYYTAPPRTVKNYLAPLRTVMVISVTVDDMHTLSVRFTDAQMQAITRLAKRDHRARAAIVRELASQAIRQRGPEYKELLDAEDDKSA